MPSVLEFRVALVFSDPVQNVDEVEEKVRDALARYRNEFGIAPEGEETCCNYFFVELVGQN